MKICALRMLQHNLVFLGVLGILTACAVEPLNSSVSPRVTASPEVSETKADWRIYQTRLAPDQRHLAIWRYQASDSLAPFFDISQSEVLVMDLTTQQVIYQLPWTALTHSGLYAGAADQL